jgi:hypothetical protein
MLPISLMVSVLFLTAIILWAVWIVMYFVVVWVMFVPAVWSVHEIWGCFARSITTKVIRNLVFLVCLVCFPLIFVFFYFLTFAIIVYCSFYKRDMGELVQGNRSLALSCRKMYLSKKLMWNSECKCCMTEKCYFC